MTLDNTRILGRNSSVLLDIIRFSAALAVVVSHLPMFIETTRIPPWLGNEAVCVFFVLSGLVIRFVTETRVSTLKAYLIDRASRIYSVVIPALLFTFAAEGLARYVSPSGYSHFVSTSAWSHIGMQLFSNLTFTMGFWSFGKSPLSNGVFWSLPFEVAYYCLYGLLRYTKSARFYLIPVGLVLVGPSIAGLFPIWLMGAFLFDCYASMRYGKSSVKIAAAISAATIAALLVLRHPILRLIAATDDRRREAWVTHLVASNSLGQRLFHGADLNWVSRFSISYFFVSALLFPTLLLLMLLLDRKLPPLSQARANCIRVIADSTFTLYLIHRPFLILFYSVVVGHRTESWPLVGFTVTLAVLLSMWLAMSFDEFKNLIRSGLSVVLGSSARERRSSVQAGAEVRQDQDLLAAATKREDRKRA